MSKIIEILRIRKKRISLANLTKTIQKNYQLQGLKSGKRLFLCHLTLYKNNSLPENVLSIT